GGARPGRRARRGDRRRVRAGRAVRPCRRPGRPRGVRRPGERGGAPPAARAPPEPHPPSLVRVKEASAVSRAAPAGRSGTPVRPGILDGVREGNRAVHPLRVILLYVLRDRPTRTRSPAT